MFPPPLFLINFLLSCTMGCLKGLFTMASNKRLLFNEIYDTIKPCPCWHAISLCLKSERNCIGFSLTFFSNELDSTWVRNQNFFQMLRGRWTFQAPTDNLWCGQQVLGYTRVLWGKIILGKNGSPLFRPWYITHLSPLVCGLLQ